MRVRVVNGPLTVQATAGTHVVLLGMDLDEALAAELMGFAVHRVDHTEGQAYWLPNQLLFAGNDKGAASKWSSRDNPVQTFRWGDYTAKPAHQYTYTVVARGGSSAHLTDLAEVTVQVGTENPDLGTHAVYFNRGAMASQWYAVRFKNAQPADVPNREAYKWLSRGLEEALLGFIGQASSSRWSLRGALYEFTYAPVLQAFRLASQSGADVQLVVDAVGAPTAEPSKSNEVAIAGAGIGSLVSPRTHVSIAHNKFVVACLDGRPVSVWTGSTNVTEGGIFGQSNVGHVVRDVKVARSYLDAWDRIRANPMPKPMKAANDASWPVPPQRLNDGVHSVFTPRGSLAALDWYAKLAGRARTAVFLTAAFGLSDQMEAVFTQERRALKYLLLDKDDGVALTVRSADPDNQVSVGAMVPRGGWGQWVREVTLNRNKHVRYIHTKYLLIDPLGDDPIVVTGSANFSKASMQSNDENMLVIRGDTAVADVYLTEYMRLFTHYEFRGRTKTPKTQLAPGPETVVDPRSNPGRLYLKEMPLQWVPRWFEPRSPRAKERLLFSGS
jgi:phosphatidylserine/phosphatidylglycerophosphate/cardiolipin synthase-like enzyme